MHSIYQAKETLVSSRRAAFWRFLEQALHVHSTCKFIYSPASQWTSEKISRIITCCC